MYKIKRDIEIYEIRDKKIYEMFCSGKSYIACGIEFEITDSGIKQALRRHRKRNNLPNGRYR